MFLEFQEEIDFLTQHMFYSLLGTRVRVCSFLYITCGGGVPVLLH